MNNDLATRIDALLPQTQCTRCGYPTCRAYAEAIAVDEADIDRCPPGGVEGVVALAALLLRAPKPLDPTCGIEAPPVVATVDETVCIGCTKCIQACPVDAIVGAAKRMHTVIAAECTGCELCLPPCPVDCIDLVAIAEKSLARARVMTRAVHARARFDARSARLARERTKRDARRGAVSSASRGAPITREAVLEAIARGNARRESLKNGRR
ncbi:MAG TPA: RnfABCDGE type electron transport complex subunit B [Rhodanobacteraceae bacterium]|jgi:electron transport complex protein RnfB|nr:RnfABCDGE type electron transport complex subunit B [Rhodanobacteraceae bacterium]